MDDIVVNKHNSRSIKRMMLIFLMRINLNLDDTIIQGENLLIYNKKNVVTVKILTKCIKIIKIF